MSTPDSSSNAQVIDPTGISVNGIENRGNAGIAVHSTGHLGQSSLRMNNGDFNRPEILPMGTGFHNSSPKKNNFQSRLAHFQQLALNNTNAVPPSTREIQTNNAPPSTKFRNFNIPVSIREIDPVDSVPAPSRAEKIKPPNINTLFNTREIHPIDATLNTAERFKYDTPQPSPRQSLSLNPASIVTGLRKPPGNDFQARLAHFRELALNSKNDADFIPQVGTGRRYSCNVMTAPPSPIQLEHFAFHKSGAASVINMPTTTNLLQSEIDSTPPTNIIVQSNSSTAIKSNGLAASNDQLRAGIADTLSVPPSKDKDAHNSGASVVPRGTPAGKVVPAPKAISIEKEVPRYPITLSPAPPDVTEHQLVKTIRNARSPGPVPLKGYRPTIAAVSSPPVEPKPRIRVPGRKEGNTARPSRRNRKAMNEYQQMPAVLMLMHDRSKSFSQAKMDIACAAAAEICETPLTFADFSLCRPEDRKIDITGHGLNCEKIIRGIEFAFREENVGIQDVFIQHERFCVVLRTTTTKFKIPRTSGDTESVSGHREPYHVPDDTSNFQYWGMRVCDHMVAPILPSHAFYFEVREEDFQSDLDGESTVVDGLGAGPSGANFLLHKEDIVEWLETGVFTL